MIINHNKSFARYFARHPDVSLIVIAGSSGHTSAIRALGIILSQELEVAVGVNHREQPDVVILDQESSSNLSDLKPDITIVPAIFNDADAKTAFAIANRSKYVLVNRSDVPDEYVKYLDNPHITTYGDEMPAENYWQNEDFNIETGYTGTFMSTFGEPIRTTVRVLGEHNLRPIIAAVTVAHLFEIPTEKIAAALADFHPLAGRLNAKKGLNGSWIVDDTNNSAPRSIHLALRTIYSLDAPSRILVTHYVSSDLLESFSPDLLSEVLVLGNVDPEVLSAADKKGVKIVTFSDMLSLLAHLRTRLEPEAIILLKTPVPDLTIDAE